jgi:hypothetical protein
MSATELWHVECKGSPSKRYAPELAAPYGTHTNQFDRALASSSYDTLQEEANRTAVTGHLGLALPITDRYLRELNRGGKGLRARLNLWVLLFYSRAGKIVPVAPSDKYPTS